MATVFLDTETTGLAHDRHIWEFAALRREDDWSERRYHFFVQHDLALAGKLPEPFRTDHDTRYDPKTAISTADLAIYVAAICRDEPHIVGTVPNFDTEPLARILRHHGVGDQPPWHYHLRDAETLALGYLRGRASLGDHRADQLDLDDSNVISHAAGVDPERFARHTAMGDVEWAKAIHDAVMQ